MTLLRHADLLRPFLAVARHGNLSAAARELAITQPALTKNVHKLEERLGTTLFERGVRGMKLTRSGAALYDHALQIEVHCRVAESNIDDSASGLSGRIRVGAGPYWGMVLPAAIARLQEQFPRLDVTLDVGVNEITLPKLFAGDLDLVMCRLPEAGTTPPGIERRAFLDIHLRVAAAKRHPLHAKRRITGSDLVRYPWVLYHHDRDVMHRLAAVLKESGLPPPVIRVETTSLLSMLQLLRAGPYLACIPEAYLRAAAAPDIAPLRFTSKIWSFESGALFHESLRDFTPIKLLMEALARDVR